MKSETLKLFDFLQLQWIKMSIIRGTIIAVQSMYMQKITFLMMNFLWNQAAKCDFSFFSLSASILFFCIFFSLLCCVLNFQAFNVTFEFSLSLTTFQKLPPCVQLKLKSKFDLKKYSIISVYLSSTHSSLE